jgi:hypothetical protein
MTLQLLHSEFPYMYMRKILIFFFISVLYSYSMYWNGRNACIAGVAFIQYVRKKVECIKLRLKACG